MAEPANTPIPGSTPRSASPLHQQGITSPISPTKLSTLSGAPRPRVLVVGGDADQLNQSADYAALAGRCDIIRVDGSRDELVEGLRDKRWSKVDVVLSIEERLPWDAELVETLPSSVKLVVSEGDVDEKLFKNKGTQIVCLKTASGTGSSTSALHGVLSLVESAIAHGKPASSKPLPKLAYEEGDTTQYTTALTGPTEP